MTSARDRDFSGLSFQETISYYNGLRKVLYDELNATFPQFNHMAISLGDTAQADKWQNVDPGNDRDVWSWLDAHRIYNKKSCFKRFDLCVKSGGFVSGLSYGLPSQSKTRLKIDIIEATPIEKHKHNTRIFEVISTAAQYYAVLLGADEVRIMNPLNQDLVNYYCSYGYEYVANGKKKLGVYCSMKVEV